MRWRYFFLGVGTTVGIGGVILLVLLLSHYVRPREKARADAELVLQQALPEEIRLAQLPGARPEEEMPLSPLRARKIIYEAWLTVQVSNLRRAVQEVEAIVQRMEGYVAMLEHAGGSPSPYVEITLRIPSARFESAFKELSQLGKVQRQRKQTRDVTEEWIDLEARLRNLRREEERLLELLKKAGKVSELLEVERELARVRGEIERMEGRLRYLGNRVAFSTIRLTLILPSVQTPTGWSLKAVWLDARRLFVVISQGTITFFVYLFVLLPYLAGAGVLVWLLQWLWLRWRRVSKKMA